MNIRVKRIYEKPEGADGFRILVDKLWPRGVSKTEAKLDDWFKSITPSDALRKWFGHDPVKWDEFQKRYKKELQKNQGQVDDCLEKIRDKEVVTFLFSTRENSLNHAHFLKAYFEKLLT